MRIAKPAQAGDSSAAHKPVAALSPYIDVHTHLDETNVEGSMQAAIRDMPQENLARIVFMPSPFTLADANRFDIERLLPGAKKYPGKIYLLGGGGTLNPMIIEAARSGDAGPAVQQKFKERAEAILAAGAVGFGEMAAEHFPSSTPYESAPPDHPLFLLLADIAAQHGVPICIHMEAVPQDMDLPAPLKSPPNPPRLHANIAALRAIARPQSARQNRLGAPRMGYDGLSHAGADAASARSASQSLYGDQAGPGGYGQDFASLEWRFRHNQAGVAEALY